MKNPHFITSIYHYCDRWCSRCSKTTQCRVFVDNQEKELSANEQNIRKEAFWIKLSEKLPDFIEMLEKKSLEMGADLEELIPGPPSTIESDHAKLIDQATIYGIEVNPWMNDLYFRLKQSGETIEGKSEESVDQIIEAFEVLRWYSLLISVKISRAAYKMNDPDDELADYDQVGAAKMALISLDRSIAAFTTIFKEFPQEEDEILIFLAKLAKIKQGLILAFPGVKLFKRPGFDDEKMKALSN